MTEVRTQRWRASDGVELAVHEMGEGPAVVLLHGLFSSAFVNWIKYGTAERIAATGRRVIMPDHRAHGQSAAPHEPVHYPPGIIARDATEMIAHLGLADYDMGGFSLGARTVLQTVGEGLRPRRAILSGMGLPGLVNWASRQQFFVDALANFDTSKRGDPHWMSIQFMKTMKVDLTAAALVLESFGDSERQWFDAFTMPTLVLIGDQDQDNGSAAELAEILPDGRYVEIPGNHMNCITKPDFGEAIARFIEA